jgi:type IV pilus assembly protein PilM
MLPGVKEHQINAIIESNITEYFPIELTDYKIAHIKLETITKGENIGKHKVLVIAAEKKMLECYEKLASLLKLNLADIDYSGNSTFQVTKYKAGANPIMVIKAENDAANITIIREGKLLMQRGVNYNQGHLLDEDVHVLTTTVVRLIDFYVSKYENSNIDRIYILGDASTNQDLVDMVQLETQILAETPDSIRGIILPRKLKCIQLGIFANVIGAGMSSVGLDNELEKQRHETNYVSASILMILLIASLAASIVVWSAVPYNEALYENTRLEQKRNELQPAKEVYDQYNEMLSLIAKVRYGNSLTMNSNDGIVDFLEELEKVLPSDVEISDFSSTDTTCVMTMMVDSKETAAGVINNLRTFESIDSLTVSSISDDDASIDSEDSSDNGLTVSFTITVTYKVDEKVEP